MVSVGVYLGTLTWLSVHPASPVLLTRNGPLGALAFTNNIQHTTEIIHISNIIFLTGSQFENRLRSVMTLIPLIIRFTR